MKTILLSLALLLACAPASGAAAPAAGELHLGLSPFMGEAQRRAVGRALPGLVLDPVALPAGTRVVIWDAWQLVRVADFVLKARQFDTSQARALALQTPLLAVGRWLNTPPSRVEGLAPDSGALRAPEWLFEASVRPASGVRAFLLIGSALYASPAEPAFDMAADARYPSDGHLTLGLRDSVFGLAEKGGRLDRAVVHWVVMGDEPWANELHRHSVTRFWTLFVQGQGGTLASFGADWRAAFSHALQPGLPPVLRVQPDSADEKALMRSARPRSLPAWLEPVPAPAPVAVPATVEPPAPAPSPEPAVEKPAPVVAPPVADPAPAPTDANVEVAVPAPAPVETAPAPAPIPVAVPMPAKFDATKTGLGIAWPQSIDLDLHVLLRPGARELSYLQDRTAEGFLYKDERKANAGRFYEFVEFTESPVDLSQARVWVHYYSGRAENVTGQVVLFDRGQVKVGTFTLRAAEGNRRDSTRDRASSPHWIEIRLADLADTTSPLAASKPGRSLAP